MSVSGAGGPSIAEKGPPASMSTPAQHIYLHCKSVRHSQRGHPVLRWDMAVPPDYFPRQLRGC